MAAQRRALGLAALLIVAIATLPACASAKAQAVMPDGAPLSIPPAPARVVVPQPPDPPRVVVDPVPPMAGTPTTTINPPTGATRPTRDTRPPTPPASTSTPPPNTTSPANQTSTTAPLETQANQSELERRARDLITTATGTLDKIDYRALTTDGKAQYDTARRFLEQAATALKTKNVVFGWQLADKANTIATLLQRR